MSIEALIWEQEKQQCVRSRKFTHGQQYWIIFENYVAERNERQVRQSERVLRSYR